MMGQVDRLEMVVSVSEVGMEVMVGVKGGQK